MRTDTKAELRRLDAGAVAGVAAAVVMSLLMIAGQAARVSALHRPFPFLIVQHATSARMSGVATAALAVFAHFVYGAAAGFVFAYVARPMTVGNGLAYGLMLWFAMQITFIPWLGWADFGLARSLTFAPYVLLMHLAYGAVLGWLGHRHDVAHHARFDELARLRTR